MDKKKKPTLWFEDPMENIRRTEEDFHRNMAEMWKEPMKFTIRMPQIKMQKMRMIPINLAETKDELLLRAELPGFRKEEIKLNVTSNTISINASKKEEKIEKEKGLYKREFGSESASRSITLPQSIDANSVKAKFENGLLEINMKKKKGVSQRDITLE